MTNWCVFIAVLGGKLPQNGQSLSKLYLGRVRRCFITNMQPCFCFTWTKSPDYIEDVDNSELWGSAPPHPVRLQVKTVQKMAN